MNNYKRTYRTVVKSLKKATRTAALIERKIERQGYLTIAEAADIIMRVMKPRSYKQALLMAHEALRP